MVSPEDGAVVALEGVEMAEAEVVVSKAVEGAAEDEDAADMAVEDEEAVVAVAVEVVVLSTVLISLTLIVTLQETNGIVLEMPDGR